jgi:serine/threonine protein kinase
MADRVGQQLGNYRLLRELGQGNFATVYLGEHLYLERLAAIKVLHVRMEPAAFESFRREARIIAQLRHSHIVGVHDFGIVEQTPYLVMEYTPGGTLRERYPKGTCLTYEQIITYVKQIASALDYAHQQHVIHRDIKPANLLLNAQGEVVLSDFGIAVVQRTLESLSEQNAAGTPLYMAPEQIQHQPCAASDQYALGVMVYEWLCGEPPFRGPGVAIFGQHLHQAPPSLCARLPHLSPVVEDAIFGTLAKDPAQRFPTVQDFASVLEEACFATQPIALRLSQEQELPPLTTPGPVTQGYLASQQTKVPLSQRNRQALLRKVSSFWIEGVLNHSLHGAALMTLGLETQPDAVANPWHLVLQHPDATPHLLPTGTRITQVYDDAQGDLLILGAPGAGKTTLLLELARDLLSRAHADGQHPLPVVFNLSSWAMKQQLVTDWLIDELHTKYQVPSRLAQALLSADQILPLLDGLDEVAPTARTACIEEINMYREEHGLFPLVVCSRQADYLAQSGRLLMRSAVTVQPLTQEQIDAYLGEEALWALRLALHQAGC